MSRGIQERCFREPSTVSPFGKGIVGSTTGTGGSTSAGATGNDIVCKKSNYRIIYINFYNKIDT
jgi:hypothetical protein